MPDTPSQSLVDKFSAIEVWMKETEEAVSSQDSYKEDALSPDGINLILNYFMEVLEVERLDKKPLLVMVKSVTLFLTVTKNLDLQKDNLVTLLDALLIAVLRAHVSEKVTKICVNEVTFLLEKCLGDPNSRDYIIGGFTQRILYLVKDDNIAFWIRCSLLKSFNMRLSESPMELRTDVFKEYSQEFEGLVDCLYTSGDFDMQTTIVETLLRFTTKSIRTELSNNWFPGYVKLQSLFLGIKDFEADCRKFLNHFNEGLKEKAMVFSFKLLSCVVEGKTLVKPADISDFWIDFNLGSNSLSVYYALNDNQDSSWNVFRLSRSQVAKIQSGRIQGNWCFLIFSSADLRKADIVLEFSQPQSIPDKISKIFGSSLASEKQSLSTGPLSVRPKTPGSGISKARLIASDDPGIKASATTKGLLVKTGKSDSRTSFHALSSSQDQSSLPCAQPPPVSKISAKKPSSYIPQKLINQVKKVSKLSMAGSLKLTKKSKSMGSLKTKSPKMKSPKQVSKVSKPSPKESPKPSGKTGAKKIQTSPIVENDDDSLGAIVKSQESSKRVLSKRKSKIMANSKIADIKDLEAKGSEESLLKDVNKTDKTTDLPKVVDDPQVPRSEAEPTRGEISPVDIGNEGLTAEVLPETENDVGNVEVKTNRLSYSGRRIRAQRKALKRKSENPEIPVVRKKICFDEADTGKVIQGRKNSQNIEPKSNEELNASNAKKDNGKAPVPVPGKSTAKSLLSDWDDIFNDPIEENELSETIHVVPDAKGGGQKEAVKDSAPETIKPSVISESHKSKLDAGIQQNDPDHIEENIPNPAQSEDPIRDKEDESSKAMSAPNTDSSAAGAREPTKKKRKSSKVLFSETILDSEADLVQVSDSNELRPEVVPTYDQTYRRVASKPSFKSGSTTKPSKVDSLDSSSILNPEKKFFKEKDSDKPYEFLKPSSSSKPKRTYQRRPSTTTKSATKDPYSFTGNPPKGRRSSYLQQKRRVTGSSKRRSDKLFSDDEGGDSVQGSPEKTFGDSGLRISDVGDTGIEEEEAAANSTLQEKKPTSSYSSRRRPNNKEMSKQTLVMLEHMSGMLKAVANMSEGISKKVLSDVSFFIVQKSDLLVLE